VAQSWVDMHLQLLLHRTFSFGLSNLNNNVVLTTKYWLLFACSTVCSRSNSRNAVPVAKSRRRSTKRTVLADLVMAVLTQELCQIAVDVVVVALLDKLRR